MYSTVGEILRANDLSMPGISCASSAVAGWADPELRSYEGIKRMEQNVFDYELAMDDMEADMFRMLSCENHVQAMATLSKLREGMAQLAKFPDSLATGGDGRNPNDSEEGASSFEFAKQTTLRGSMTALRQRMQVIEAILMESVEEAKADQQSTAPPVAASSSSSSSSSGGKKKKKKKKKNKQHHHHQQQQQDPVYSSSSPLAAPSSTTMMPDAAAPSPTAHEATPAPLTAADHRRHLQEASRRSQERLELELMCEDFRVERADVHAIWAMKEHEAFPEQEPLVDPHELQQYTSLWHTGVEGVARALRRSPFAQYTERFKRLGITGADLCGMTEMTLCVEMGLSNALHRRGLMRYINAIKWTPLADDEKKTRQSV
jgi:hypothetical protein